MLAPLDSVVPTAESDCFSDVICGPRSEDASASTASADCWTFVSASWIPAVPASTGLMWTSASTEDWSAWRLAQVAALPVAVGTAAEDVVDVLLEDVHAASATATSTGAMT